MSEANETRCPLCGVAWRGATECRRCGADLTLIMNVAVAAWRLRDQARREILAATPHDALRSLAAAQKLQRTAEGERLGEMAAWLRKH